MSNYTSLIGRCVVVTGGSRGLGRAMAIGLLRAGARVAIVCTGPGRALEETIRLVQSAAAPSQWTCAFGDLEQPGDCERVAAEILSSFGQIDVLINNAGARTNGSGAPFWQIPTEEWLRISHTNCDSVFLLSKAIVPSMIGRRFGKIINVSTNGRTMAREKFSPYGPSKAFVEACTRTWARELNGSGVTMNALLPGGNVDTAADMTGPAAHRSSSLPASIMVAPVLWLAADESNGHTGERFVANLWNEDLDLSERVAAARQSGIDTPSIM
ncbi:MAG TPA: SDR family oxidoreductase [Beijerinckiaceae bacterium]|nr:SDR family oxidoreductase [Beijerinckiaceae bacterium]